MEKNGIQSAVHTTSTCVFNLTVCYYNTSEFELFVKVYNNNIVLHIIS